MTNYPDLVLLATVPGANADWSPDAARFVVYEGRIPNIRPSSVFVADQQGNPLTVLFSDDVNDKYDFGGLAWARGADRIAFSFGGVPSTSPIALQRDIYVVAPDGSDLVALAATEADEFDPSWSPDGEWLVYIAAAENSPAAVGVITFARADGSCVISTMASERLSGVDWSPDGSQLALTFRDKLYVVDIATLLNESSGDPDVVCARHLPPLD